MDTGKINDKLGKFSTMILKDAAHKAGILINEARAKNQKMMENKELAFLKEAYNNIQEALRRIERESNHTYSKKLMEGKHTLFKKRSEIIDGVFGNVEERLIQYRESTEYGVKLRELIEKGLKQVGDGEVHIYLDNQDMCFAETLKNGIREDFTVEESNEQLSGGCVIINTTLGIMADYSFKSRLVEQSEIFMEKYGIDLEL